MYNFTGIVSNEVEHLALVKDMVLLNNHSKTVDKNGTPHMKFSQGLSVSSLTYERKAE
jgi:hypothetical protein